MCIGRCQRHSQPSNDPDVGLRHCDLPHDRQCDNARGQMQEFTMGKFHGVALNCLREDFRDAFSLDVRTDGSPGPSNFRERFSTSTPLPPRWRKDEESGRIKSRRCMSTRNMSGKPVSIQHQRHTGLLSRGSLQGAHPFEQAVGKLKRFERSALRCEKTAQNYGSFVALALGIILIKSVRTA